jgi:3-methyladenine DNA glycosylase/8-oxoguanine DNA glycosylase
VGLKGSGVRVSCVGLQADGLTFYAFPTLEQLSLATEEELRAAGFGYR